MTATFTTFAQTNFYDVLLPDLPGANTDFVQQTLDRVVRDYFRRTQAWTDRLVPAAAFTAGLHSIDLNQTLADLSKTYKIAQVHAVFDEDTQVPAASTVRLSKREDLTGLRRWHCPQWSVVEFSGKAWEDDKNLEYIVSYYPGEGSTTYEQWVWDEHSDAIIAGVLGRMMGQSKKTYSNPVDARIRTNEYNSIVNKRRAEADRGNVPHGHTWSFPRTF